MNNNLNIIYIVASEKDFVRDLVDPKETFDPNSSISITRAIKRYLKITDNKIKVKNPREFINTILNKKYHYNK